MIEFITGTLGASKTWTAVERIGEYLKRGAYITTNVELREDGIRKHFGDEAWERIYILKNREEIVTFYKFAKTGGEVANLCVIDEVHKYLDAKDWAKNRHDHKVLLDWLDMSRRFRNDIILISQVPKKVDSRVRDLAEIFTFRRDWSKLPVVGFFWPGFYEVTRDQDGKTKIRGQFKLKRKWVGECYNTHAIVGDKPEGSGEIAEVVTPTSTVKRFSWRLLVPVVGLILGLWYGAAYYRKFVSGEALGGKPKATAPVAPTGAGGAPAGKAPAPEPPPDDRSDVELFFAESPYLGVSCYLGGGRYSVGAVDIHQGKRLGRWDVLAIEDGLVWLRWEPTGQTRKLRLLSRRDDPSAPILEIERKPLYNPQAWSPFPQDGNSGHNQGRAHGLPDAVGDRMGGGGARPAIPESDGRIIGEIPAPVR